MELKRAVLDTNVFVAAGFKPESSSARIIQAVRERRLRSVWNVATRRETEFILEKIPPLRQTSFSDCFSLEDRFDQPTPLEDFAFVPDPDDRKFAALAVAAGAVLVSSDKLLLQAKGEKPLVVLSPHAYWAVLHDPI